MELSDFQCGESDGGEGDGEQPETDNDLGLGPAAEVEMMMQGCASEESFSAGVPEIEDL